jgi:hypothetical protein
VVPNNAAAAAVGVADCSWQQPWCDNVHTARVQGDLSSHVNDTIASCGLKQQTAAAKAAVQLQIR